MATPSRWPRTARPNPEVIEALESALLAARSGQVQAVAIVVVNPLHEVEDVVVGNLSGPISFAMIGGLSSAAHKLLQRS